MLEDRLLDTKRNLEMLADQTGKSMEDILKLLSQDRWPLDSKFSIQNGQSPQDKSEPFAKGDRTPLHTPKPDGVDQVINRALDLIQDSILNLNRATMGIMENVVEQMVTKKIYKIRQSFRELILTLLGVKQMAIYISHQSGRVEFQDFSSNFITEIMEEDSKCGTFQKIIRLAPAELLFVDLADNSDLMKLFDINSTERNIFYAAALSMRPGEQGDNLAYCLMVKVQARESASLSDVLTPKLISKVIEICQISTYEDSFYLTSKIYAKKMLDLLEILIIQYDLRLKKALCSLCKVSKQSFFSLTNISKIIISKIDQNLANQQTIFMLKKLTSQFEQMEYKKIEEIRMYKKYLRESKTILLQFNRVGVLLFISGNRDHPYLNDLTRIWEEGKPCMDQLFGKNSKFQSYLKKAVRGSLKTQRPLQIDNEVTAKITANGKRIEKIHITITDKEVIQSVNSKQRNILEGQDGKENGRSQNNRTLKQLEKENPGILKEGWLDLFLKNSQDKTSKEGENMAKKNNTFTSADLPSLKGKRQLSYISAKEQFRINIEDIAIDSSSINFLTFNDKQLQSFAIKVLDNLDYFQGLPQEREKLSHFIGELQDHYEIHSNPFHNFKHGINVMHSCYLLSTLSANLNILTVKDIFVNVFSGLCHDVGHTGFTNAFEIASSSRKAMIYNDKSPLQNFHASLTFELLRKEENNFLCHMEREEFIKFRKAVIENILYTDIKEHFPLLNSFNELLRSGKALGREDAPILSYMIVHSSDFAGSAKQFEICKEWSRRVNMEFSNQYRMEGEIGIPQTPFMKDLTNPVVLSKAEGGFLRVIVYPLYQALDALYITEGMVHKLKKNIEDNIKAWQEMNKIESQKAKAMDQKPQ